MPNESSSKTSVRLWPTPNSFDALTKPIKGKEETYANLHALKLSNAVHLHRLYPTPRSTESTESTETQEARAARGTKASKNLTAIAREYSPTSPASTAPSSEASPLLPAGFLASHFPLPGSDEARQITARSGRKCCALLQKQDPLGFLEKTLLESSTWNSTVCFLTWKPSATPQGRLLFRLVPSMPDTDETEFGLWPTMQHRDHNTVAKRKRGANSPGGTPLAVAAAMFPTPTIQDAENNAGPSQSERNTPPLNAVAGGALNPTWVEWLMGYPSEWTALKDSATPSSRKSPKK